LTFEKTNKNLDEAKAIRYRKTGNVCFPKNFPGFCGLSIKVEGFHENRIAFPKKEFQQGIDFEQLVDRLIAKTNENQKMTPNNGLAK
jgi:hypothetical protein